MLLGALLALKGVGKLFSLFRSGRFSVQNMWAAVLNVGTIAGIPKGLLSKAGGMVSTPTTTQGGATGKKPSRILGSFKKVAPMGAATALIGADLLQSVFSNNNESTSILKTLTQLIGATVGGTLLGAGTMGVGGAMGAMAGYESAGWIYDLIAGAQQQPPTLNVDVSIGNEQLNGYIDKQISVSNARNASVINSSIPSRS